MIPGQHVSVPNTQISVGFSWGKIGCCVFTTDILQILIYCCWFQWSPTSQPDCCDQYWPVLSGDLGLQAFWCWSCLTPGWTSWLWCNVDPCLSSNLYSSRSEWLVSHSLIWCFSNLLYNSWESSIDSRLNLTHLVLILTWFWKTLRNTRKTLFAPSALNTHIDHQRSSNNLCIHCDSIFPQNKDVPPFHLYFHPSLCYDANLHVEGGGTHTYRTQFPHPFIWWRQTTD